MEGVHHLATGHCYIALLRLCCLSLLTVKYELLQQTTFQSSHGPHRHWGGHGIGLQFYVKSPSVWNIWSHPWTCDAHSQQCMVSSNAINSEIG